jgi:hypothetical protein
MTVIQCIDCGEGRRYSHRRGGIPKRCKPCAMLRGVARVKAFREEKKRKKLCRNCGEKLSGHSIAYCDVCASYHAGYQASAMREKRAASPAYREDERNKVRARMQNIRAERRKSSVNNAGVPYKSEVWKRRMMARDGAGLSAS